MIPDRIEHLERLQKLNVAENAIMIFPENLCKCDIDMNFDQTLNSLHMLLSSINFSFRTSTFSSNYYVCIYTVP